MFDLHWLMGQDRLMMQAWQQIGRFALIHIRMKSRTSA